MKGLRGRFGIGWWQAVFLALILAGLPLAYSCAEQGDGLRKIREAGEIRVFTRNNAHCYYNYRDKPMGFEYELAKAFSEYLGVRLTVVTPDWDDLIPKLEEGAGDFIAASMTITEQREERVDFSGGYLEVQQQVVVHKNNRNMDSVEDLEGRTIHVRSGTSYLQRLEEIQKQGLDFEIVQHKDLPTEELIRMVAKGEIDLTVADSNIAMLNRRYFPDVRIAFPLEEAQYLGWAVRPGEGALLKEMNRFFEKIREDGTFAKIYEKYYANVEIFDYVDLRKYHRRIRTRLPEFAETIKEAAAKNGFDWRLIAAVVYQESHFDPHAVSHTGVRGLMQITLTTAQEMGIDNRLDAKQSIFGGVAYLRKLYERYEQASNPDRLLISLASYNVGSGHVRDAQSLAEEMGLDPNSWAALEEALPLLRYPQYYKKTRHGYCRGTEPVRYVRRILTYYDILKREAIT